MSKGRDGNEVGEAGRASSHPVEHPTATRTLAVWSAGLLQNRRSWWFWVLSVGTVCYLAVLRTLLVTNNLNFLPALLLLGSAVAPASVLVFTSVRTRTTIPTPILALVAFAGGVLGTVAAGTLEYDALQRLDVLPMLLVALIEESTKVLVPVLVLLLSRDKWPWAGASVGVASATGFASLETMGYGLQALLHTGRIADVDQTLLLRGLVSPACHVAWTGSVVAVLWRTRYSSRRRRAALLTSGVFAAVVGLHTLWDSSSNTAVHLGVAVASIACFLAAMNTHGLPDPHRQHASRPLVQPSGTSPHPAPRPRELP